MKVKICGITREEDARLAAALGADAIGMVFWPGSRRAVSVEQAQRIVAALPPLVAVVGVFVDQPADEIEAVASAVRLGAVQLHGRETPAFARGLACRVIKAVPVGADGPTQRTEDWAGTLLLLDADDPVHRGGTGRTIDWGQAARIARQQPVMLAGGLSPENVTDAVAHVRPMGIDVSSGVERAPGVKDPDRLRALFAALGRVEG